VIIRRRIASGAPRLYRSLTNVMTGYAISFAPFRNAKRASNGCDQDRERNAEQREGNGQAMG